MAPSPPMTVASLAYFPKSDFSTSIPELHEPLPVPATEISPIFDLAAHQKPIPSWEEGFLPTLFPGDVDGAARRRPPTPPEFRDPYLYPALAKNERLRLTMLWYYTRGLTEDKELLMRLQDKLEITKELMGWEYAIIGVLDNDAYTRVATCGLPLAILPRRESTCSHTINIPPRSVLMLNDMQSDWRFQHSPHVEHGGLQSYAGTQLLCKTEDGQEVALGSLCVASNTRRELLSPEKQANLVKFSDMITAEIVTGCQLKRQRQRRRMADLLANVQARATVDNVESLILNLAGEIYPEADVSIQDSLIDMLTLKNRNPIPVKAVRDGLWEDTEYIDKAIASGNHQRLCANQTVRVIAYQCFSADPKYLIVASSDVQYIFDDVDAWFVERCSFVISNLSHERSIKEAMDIKDRFFRGITHQLRTPIHGILGSCQLLEEELGTLITGNSTAPEVTGQQKSIMAEHISSYLSTIQHSGEELMATINNMLKLNRWSEIQNSPPNPQVCDLQQFESDLCTELQQIVPDAELADITIFIQNEVPVEARLIYIDAVLLKECLQSLLLNAVQYTKKGEVLLNISTRGDLSTLVFDVIDSGCGIQKEDQERIFDAYEKANTLSPGAGLGLTLALKIALAMNGRVSLVSSGQEKGSHFRAEFRDPGFACPRRKSQPLPQSYQGLPQRFRLTNPACTSSILANQFASYLRSRGLTQCDESDAPLVVVDHIPDVSYLNELSGKLKCTDMAVYLTAGGVASQFKSSRHPNVHFFTGPFHTHSLEDIFTKIRKHMESSREISLPARPALQEISGNIWKDSSQMAIKEIHEPSCLRALLVDDNPINLRIMRMYCEKRRIPYATAVDGQEAVEHYMSATPDLRPSLILMDLQMPNLDGATATKQIRQFEGREALKPAVVFVGV